MAPGCWSEEEFARQIKADEYAADAGSAASLAKRVRLAVSKRADHGKVPKEGMSIERQVRDDAS